MTAPAAESKSYCKRLTPAASTANSLLVVKTHRRHICQHDCLEVSNIHANLHSSRDAENIYFVNPLEIVFFVFKINNHTAEVPLAFSLVISLGC